MSNLGFDPRWSSPWFRPPLDDLPGFRVGQLNAVPAGEPNMGGWQPPFGAPGEASPDGALPVPEAATVPWWERQADPVNVFPNTLEPRWPWLRAPTDDIPGFQLNPDGSAQADKQGDNIRLMSGALSPLEPQEPPAEVASGSVGTSSDVVPPPSTVAPPSPGMATSFALPAAGSLVGDLAALAERVAPKIMAFGARIGPVAAGVGSAAVSALPLALPLMVIPAAVGSQTTDLGNGLRARVRTGQRKVEIEQRLDDGLFGSPLWASWKALPVEANIVVGRDGRPNIAIDHEQLNRALGRTAPAELSDAGISAMARPPKESNHQQLPPSTGSAAEETGKPGIGSPPVTGIRIGAKALEAARQRDPDEERLLACRAVRAMPGQPAPPGQYDGRGGIDTAAGIRLAPAFPAPKGGYDYSPDHLRHFNGYKGELQLKNRIESAVPYEKIVHYGNPAGDHGPDVMSIGPDKRIMEWDSKSRSATRRVGRHMTRMPSIRYATAQGYVDGAVAAGALSKDDRDTALHELSEGNYNLCTVGTGSAYDGYFEAVRGHTPTGPKR